jgi:hypothetical protein
VTVVEPGYFRTEFLAGNSAVYASKTIDDYDATPARRGWQGGRRQAG